MRNVEFKMAKILREEYTLSELEESLGVSPSDIEYGWETYVDENFDEVSKFLREELWFVS